MMTDVVEEKKESKEVEYVTGEMGNGLVSMDDVVNENENVVGIDAPEVIFGVRPCAYCGNTDQKKFRLVKVKVHWAKNPYFQFQCLSCGARGPHTKDPTKAIDAWQTSTRKGE